MHRIFKESLEESTGVSERIIAIFIDIRDFSRFSQKCESVDVAYFIKKTYLKIIESYFKYSSFYKPTGDGLLLTISWNDKNLGEVSQKVIDSCIKCNSEFGMLHTSDPSINFVVPNKIGIGVTRGSCCCLVSGKKVIDYSGRLINLAARLTDLARPSGIVLDSTFVIDLLTPEQKKIFKEENVFIRGIHEEEPIKIFYTHEFTSIPEYNKQSLTEKKKIHVHNIIFSDLQKMNEVSARYYRYHVDGEPDNKDKVEIMVQHSAIYKGEIQTRYESYFYTKCVKIGKEGEKNYIAVDVSTLFKKLEQNGVKSDMKIKFTTTYSEKSH